MIPYILGSDDPQAFVGQPHSGFVPALAQQLRKSGQISTPARWRQSCSATRVASRYSIALRAGVAAASLFVACGGNVDRKLVPVPTGGPGIDGSGGTASSGGASPNQSGGRSPASGDAGAGGSAWVCEGGLRVLQTITPAPRDVVALPGQRVAWVQEGAIRIYDVSAVAPGGSLELVVELTRESLELASGWRIDELHEYGAGLLVVAKNEDRQSRFFSWMLGPAAIEMELPLSGRVEVADPVSGMVFGREQIQWTIESEGSWMPPISFGEQGKYRTPLAFDGDDLLVGLEESLRDYGSAGSGGEAGSSGWSAAVERWNAKGERIATYPAVGNPRVAIAARDGWLIGETNSFWGSYQAALEWLEPSARALQTLTAVPVNSSGDGEDGTFGLASRGPLVFLANCESGLLHGKWQGNAVELSRLGSWPRSGDCDPTEVHALGDLLVIRGSQLTFAELCDE
jgi:hypothetical protein